MKITEGQGPIDVLDQNYAQSQREVNERLSAAQEARQVLNISTGKLADANRAIERLVFTSSYLPNVTYIILRR